MFEIDDTFLANVGYDVATLSDEQKEKYKNEITAEVNGRITDEMASTIPATTTTTTFISCLAGTRPIIIIKKTTALNSTAVDKFSSIINGTIVNQTMTIYLKA